ncbi:GxxExxY protein [candidate division WOR-3 bacterium]|nr:GxxExxY protein [candidate division WOR-3 bacterium]
MKERDPLTERIIACCFKVHRELGPGFNEKIYHNALKLALDKEGLLVNFGNKSCQVKRFIF